MSDKTADQILYLGEQLSRMDANMIDPREFGRLEAEVKALQNEVAAMREDLKELLELANKGKGGFWVGMVIASAVGALASWVAKAVLLR